MIAPVTLDAVKLTISPSQTGEFTFRVGVSGVSKYVTSIIVVEGHPPTMTSNETIPGPAT